jgi:hypothetical protein
MQLYYFPSSKLFYLTVYRTIQIELVKRIFAYLSNCNKYCSASLRARKIYICKYIPSLQIDVNKY